MRPPHGYTPNVYCPYCGVNNDRGESTCYICGMPLPSSSAAAATDTPRRAARKAAAAAETIATVGDRALALVFDRMLILSAVLVFAAWETSSTGGFARSFSSVLGAAGIYGALIFTYHVLLEGLIGTTLGKSMMSLRIRSSAERGRFVGSLLRNLLRIVDGLALYLVGFMIAMFTGRRQRLGDIVGGTVVMETRSATYMRATMMALWLVLVGLAVWFAYGMCPTCSVDRSLLARAGLIR